MDSGDLLAKGLDEAESGIELWLDVVAMVVTGSDGIRKEGHIGRKCDSGRSESAGRNSQRSFWTRKRMRKGPRRGSGQGQGDWGRTARTFRDSDLGDRRRGLDGGFV